MTASAGSIFVVMAILAASTEGDIPRGSDAGGIRMPNSCERLGGAVAGIGVGIYVCWTPRGV